VKEKKSICLTPVPGNQIVASVKIKIATVEYPPPKQKQEKKYVQELSPEKNITVEAVEVKKIPAS